MENLEVLDRKELTKYCDEWLKGTGVINFTQEDMDNMEQAFNLVNYANAIPHILPFDIQRKILLEGGYNAQGKPEPTNN